MWTFLFLNYQVCLGEMQKIGQLLKNVMVGKYALQELIRNVLLL